MITVAMPCTKDRFFEAALESVMTQTYRDFELVFINNGANPAVRQAVQARGDDRVRYLENASIRPIIENWNRCLELARGEYFVVFSDDDVYSPSFLEELLALARRHPRVDICHGRLRFIDDDGKLMRNHATAPEWESCISFMWHRLSNLRHNVAQDFMCRTSALRNLGGFVEFPLAWNSDNATWFAIAKENGLAFTPTAICNFRLSNQSLSRSGDVFQHFEADCLFSEWILRFVASLRPADSIETELVEDIRAAAREYPRAARLSILLAGLRGSLWRDVPRVVLRWLRYGTSYRIPVRTLVRALALSAAPSDRAAARESN